MSSQLPTTVLLGFTEEDLRNFNFDAPDEEKAREIAEQINDLWNAFRLYPDATEHMQTLSDNVNAMHMARREGRIEDAERARKSARAAIGSLTEVASKHKLP